MTGRNKTPLLGWHPPAELSAWAKQEAERRGGRGALSRLLDEALADLHSKLTGTVTTQAAEAPRAVTTTPKQAARQPGQPRVAPRPAAAELVARATQAAAQKAPGEPAGCEHGYPDVTWKFGRRTCRKCPG